VHFNPVIHNLKTWSQVLLETDSVKGIQSHAIIMLCLHIFVSQLWNRLNKNAVLTLTNYC